jgi:hypothetical protein
MQPYCCVCGCYIPDDEIAVDSTGYDYHQECLADNPVMSPFDIDPEDS